MSLQPTQVELDYELTNAAAKDQVSLLPELWRMIFRKLESQSELRQNVALVCKDWYNIIQNDPLFSSELKVKKEQKETELELTTENVNSLLGSYPVLKKIEFYECGSYPVLKKIEFYECEDLVLDDLNFNQCPNLEKVILGISVIGSVLNTKELKNSKCISVPFLHNVREICFHPKENLENLNITHIRSMEIFSITDKYDIFDEFDFKAFGSNLTNNLETITIHVRINYMNHWDKVALRFSEVLADVPCLKNLVMCIGQHFESLTDPNVVPISILQSCSKITRFKFRPVGFRGK